MSHIYAKLNCYFFLLLLGTSLTAQVKGINQSEILKNLKNNTKYLSSDKLEGRGAGSNGIKLAVAYISKEFGRIGLHSMADGTYIQQFSNPEREGVESNIIGFIPAATATAESIVFTAHYDGYGIISIGNDMESIYNGARDNAVGVAALIELAGMYANESAPQRNIVFVATAAEELGQYGSIYYTENPIFKVDEIVMCLNIDGFNVSGKRINFFVMPRQGVDFVDDMVLLAQRLGWIYDPPDWVDSMNTNFDTSSFLKRGIPAMTIWVGDRLINGDMAPRFNFGDIHSPLDQINEDWNWSGVMDHLELYKKTGDYFIRYKGEPRVKNPELFE